MKELKLRLKQKLPGIVKAVNQYLRGEDHSRIRRYVSQLEPAGKEPSWLSHLASTKRPERTDGKSLGTYIEKLVKAEISRFLSIPITGSSAVGVDIPELLLNTKATSDRQPQSSEPFDSPYDRVLGSKYDIVVCIYNGREFFAPASPPLRILTAQYLERTEVADNKLCATAKLLQQLVLDKAVDAKLGKRLLKAIVYAKKAGPKKPLYTGLHRALASGGRGEALDAVEKCESEMASEGEIALPTTDEWNSFLKSPLNGRIGISFALQWRYQFRRLVE